MNDSEFSSPRNDKAYAGSALEYISEKPPLIAVNLKNEEEQLGADTLQYAKTPSVMKSHKMLHLDQKQVPMDEEIKFE